MQMGIYIIANVENDHVYIGSTTNFGKRWRQHEINLRGGYHCNSYLQAAWNKYGPGTFEFAVLEYLEDPEELHVAEQEWMDGYREKGYKLYNFGLAARHGMLGTHHTEEHRYNLSRALRGNQIWLGRQHSEETKCKISETLRGRVASEETRRKMSEAHKGKHPSEETRRKIGNASRGRYHTEETKRKMGRAHARHYPAFIHRETGEVIPAGINLKAVCQEYGLGQANMHRVMTGKQEYHKGWVLMRQEGI